MNKIALIFCNIIFFLSNSFSQELVPNCGWEIYLGISIDGNSYYVSSTTAGNNMWGASHLLTDSILGTPTIKIDYQSEFEDVSIDWPYGYDFISSIQTYSGTPCERLNTSRYFPYGLFRIDYQIDTTVDPTSVYLDLRDDRYFMGDIWIKYNENTNKFEFYHNSQGWDQYDPLDTVKIWEYHSGSQSTAKFQPTNPSDLNITNYNSHPKLTWTASDPVSSAKYRIYRNSILIDSTASGETMYIDENVEIGSGSTKTYKIRAISGDWSKLSPGYSNESSVIGVFIEKRSNEMLDQDESRMISEISNIYPNPFNPQTTIKFTVGIQSLVKITVSDIIGKEVALLLNEEKEKGEYEITFNGTKLSSGTYFCELRVGNQRDIKKLIIQK